MAGEPHAVPGLAEQGDETRNAPWVAAYTPYHNQGGGRNTSPSCLYYTSVRLHPAQPVSQIILPDLTPPVPQAGDPSLHIFAATIY